MVYVLMGSYKPETTLETIVGLLADMDEIERLAEEEAEFNVKEYDQLRLASYDESNGEGVTLVTWERFMGDRDMGIVYDGREPVTSRKQAASVA